MIFSKEFTQRPTGDFILVRVGRIELVFFKIAAPPEKRHLQQSLYDFPNFVLDVVQAETGEKIALGCQVNFPEGAVNESTYDRHYCTTTLLPNRIAEHLTSDAAKARWGRLVIDMKSAAHLSARAFHLEDHKPLSLIRGDRFFDETRNRVEQRSNIDLALPRGIHVAIVKKKFLNRSVGGVTKPSLFASFDMGGDSYYLAMHHSDADVRQYDTEVLFNVFCEHMIEDFPFFDIITNFKWSPVAPITFRNRPNRTESPDA